MEKTLAVLNTLVERKILSRYALGGATALLFYAEPALTYDLDVFIFLPSPAEESGNPILNLGPLYRFLESQGYPAKKEHILIAGVPVQFIPAYNALVEEAVREALPQDYKQVKTNVVRLEYLLAIMMDTGRAKDKGRILQLIESTNVDKKLLSIILTRHHLKKKWEGTIGKI